MRGLEALEHDLKKKDRDTCYKVTVGISSVFIALSASVLAAIHAYNFLSPILNV